MVQREYTYGLQRISQNQVISGSWTPSFYGYEAFGSMLQLTNSAGVVTDIYSYDAFGVKLTHTGTAPNVYKYRGEQYDPDLRRRSTRACSSRFYRSYAPLLPIARLLAAVKRRLPGKLCNCH